MAHSQLEPLLVVFMSTPRPWERHGSPASMHTFPLKNRNPLKFHVSLPGKIKRMRLHFNQIGYQIYGKEQSRRVPAVRAKPGNPGYGFRRAKWRDTLQNPEDARHCEQVGPVFPCV